MRLLKTVTLSTLPLVCSAYLLADSPTPQPNAENVRSPGYNASADIRVNRSWDTYLTANFIYWEALQDNMELGVVSPPSNSSTSIDGHTINNDVEYKPGFQVALGFGTSYDGWNTELKYTWFHSSQSTKKSIDSSSSTVIVPLWLAPQSLNAKSASEKWKLELNVLDWTLKRTSRIGIKLLLSPFFGLRAASIDQKAHVDYSLASIPTSLLYRGKSNSWGIGPEIGISSQWLLGKGFKLYGDVETDILYTRYTNLDSKEKTVPSSGATTLRRDVSQHDLSTLRTHCDLSVGLGWGSYFCDKSYHLDLLLGYGFQVFWNQNMFRKFVDDIAKGTSFSPNGNLYIQGLTASVRFDF